jgi:hypothetical protein
VIPIQFLRGLVVVGSVAAVSAALSGLVRSDVAQAGSASLKVQKYSYDAPLAGARRVTVQGQRVGDGCSFQPPALSLQAGQRAIAARQVSTDFTNCTTVVEIGTPTEVTPNMPDEVIHGEGIETKGVRTTQSRARTMGTSQAYYKITWYDIVGLTLNYTRSILNWVWNGSCVLGSTHTWATWQQTATGWQLDYVNGWKDTGCDSHYGHVNSAFVNWPFCVPPPVRIYYNDVRIRGGYAGGYGGYLGSTYQTGSCAPLHWGAELVKDY